MSCVQSAANALSCTTSCVQCLMLASTPAVAVVEGWQLKMVMQSMKLPVVLPGDHQLLKMNTLLSLPSLCLYLQLDQLTQS